MSQGLIGTAESEGWLACVKSSGGWVVWVGVRGLGEKRRFLGVASRGVWASEARAAKADSTEACFCW